MKPREHKYRAWHPELKKFIYFTPLQLRWDKPDGGYHLTGFQEGIELFHCFKSEDVKIHQFTGFRDLNQQEIYECDIVIWPHDPTLAPRYVLFDQQEGYWRLSGDSTDGFDSLALGMNGGWPINGEHFNGPIQVVGNIIENPGLVIP